MDKAYDVLCAGGIVALPTETVYGFAVRADNAQAIQNLYALKKRLFTKPLPLVICNTQTLPHYAELNAYAQQLISLYWPGPLSLVVPKTVTATTIHPNLVKQGRIALRAPQAQWVKYFSQKGLNIPLALSSANISNTPPCTSAHAVKTLFGDKIDYILDGQCTLQKASTVLDIYDTHINVLREGALTRQDLNLPNLIKTLSPLTHKHIHNA